MVQARDANGYIHDLLVDSFGRLRMTSEGGIDLYVNNIAIGASLSGAYDINGKQVLAIQMPVAWTAAHITFQVSNDGQVWSNLVDSLGVEVDYPAAASQMILVPAATFRGFYAMKIRSGTLALPVVQPAQRIMTITRQEL